MPRKNISFSQADDGLHLWNTHGVIFSNMRDRKKIQTKKKTLLSSVDVKAFLHHWILVLIMCQKRRPFLMFLLFSSDGFHFFCSQERSVSGFAWKLFLCPSMTSECTSNFLYFEFIKSLRNGWPHVEQLLLFAKLF